MPSRYANLHRRGQKYYFFWRDEKGRRREELLRTSDIEIAQQRYRLLTEEIRNRLACQPRYPFPVNR